MGRVMIEQKLAHERLEEQKGKLLIKNDYDEPVDISELSDTHMMWRIVQERIQSNLRAMMPKGKVNDDSLRADMNDDKFNSLEDKYAENQKLLELGGLYKLDARILLADEPPTVNAAKIYGYLPKDFRIYIALNKIDKSGTYKNFKMYAEDDSEDPEDKQD